MSKNRLAHAVHNELLAQLVELCPLTFAPRGRACHPLKIGIHDDLVALLPEVSPKSVSLFLRLYTVQRRYQLAIKEGAQRLDLSGQPAGVVTTEEAAHALQRLAESDARAKASRPNKSTPAPASASAPPPSPAMGPTKEPRPAPKPPENVKQAPVVVVVKKRRRTG